MALNSSHASLRHFGRSCGLAGFPTAVATQSSRANPTMVFILIPVSAEKSYELSVTVAGFIILGTCSGVTFQACKRIPVTSYQNYKTVTIVYKVLIIHAQSEPHAPR